MRVAIVGAGAMGSLFAGYLASQLEDLWVYDVWQEHIEKIKEEGLRITRDGEDRWIRLSARYEIKGNKRVSQDHRSSGCL